MPSRREEALALAEELLTDIELRRLDVADMIRRSHRLARLLDDTDALNWLAFEVEGYRLDSKGQIPPEASAAARRSNRVSSTVERSTLVIKSVAALEADIAACHQQIQNPGSPAGVTNMARTRIADATEALNGVLGAVHSYVARRFQELRFGSAVEGAFETVRAVVDSKLAELAASALPTISTAFENASSDDPEQWRNAAAACRRLLKTCADALYPAGPDRHGRKMGDEHYINRLIGWMEDRATGDTARNFTIADLEHLGRRLDAALDAGHKGSHDGSVSKYEASRFVTGTYLLLGDVLELATGDDG